MIAAIMKLAVAILIPFIGRYGAGISKGIKENESAGMRRIWIGKLRDESSGSIDHDRSRLSMRSCGALYGLCLRIGGGSSIDVIGINLIVMDNIEDTDTGN